MNVTVNVAEDCLNHWHPQAATIQSWIQQASAVQSQNPNPCVSIRLVGEQEGHQLNLQYRNKDYATNILSFPSEIPEAIQRLVDMGTIDSPPLGDLVICLPVLDRESKEQNKDLTQHWAHLIIHGYLHLLGYDHEKDAEAMKMESLEIEILENLGFPNPYLMV